LSAAGNTNGSSSVTPTRRQVVTEIAAVFAVFFLQGAWPVPDVNEPYYLGKAIHFWNPDWASGDFFLESADAHQVFCFAYGWLSIWLAPLILAWFGRLLTWGLMAWAWRRLSFAVVPRRWFSILTAALFVCLLERCHMAGEWVIGGVEAKGFAYVLVLLGLEALVLGRWNRMWLLLGGASAFHVLVGGWSVVAAAIAWIGQGKGRPPLRSMWLALLGGLLLSLPGLVPSVMLTWGVEAELVRRANVIYVFARLPHHLAPAYFPAIHVCRFLLLAAVLFGFELITPLDGRRFRLRMFVVGALLIAAMGMGVNVLVAFDAALAAGLLRFYWFRLSDVAVPLAVSLVGARFALHVLRIRPRLGKAALAIVVLVAGLHAGWNALNRCAAHPPRGVRVASGGADRAAQLAIYSAWRRACDWVAQPANVPAGARFITPVMSQTFKWYTGHSEVATWKDVPQDARSIVCWWERLQQVYTTGSGKPGQRWCQSLGQRGAWRLRWLGAKYEADYVLTRRWPRLELEVVYENEFYIIYRLTDRREP